MVVRVQVPPSAPYFLKAPEGAFFGFLNRCYSYKILFYRCELRSGVNDWLNLKAVLELPGLWEYNSRRFLMRGGAAW